MESQHPKDLDNSMLAGTIIKYDDKNIVLYRFLKIAGNSSFTTEFNKLKIKKRKVSFDADAVEKENPRTYPKTPLKSPVESKCAQTNARQPEKRKSTTCLVEFESAAKIPKC